jgi:hypothetical protein
MDPAVPVRDQRCVSLGIYEILEILTCGGFPIRSARESTSAVIRIRVRKLCRYFSKFVTFIQWQYQAAPLGDQRHIDYRFGLSIGHSVSVFADDPGFWQCEASGDEQTRRLSDLGNQGHQIVVKLWFTIVECFSRSICLSAANHAYDRRRSTLYPSDHIAR